MDGANRGLKFSRRPGDGELFTCFFYDNPGFVVTPSSRHEEVSAVVQEAVDRGVELREARVVAKSGGRSGDWVRGDRGDAA